MEIVFYFNPLIGANVSGSVRTSWKCFWLSSLTERLLNRRRTFLPRARGTHGGQRGASCVNFRQTFPQNNSFQMKTLNFETVEGVEGRWEVHLYAFVSPNLCVNWSPCGFIIKKALLCVRFGVLRVQTSLPQSLHAPCVASPLPARRALIFL